MLYSCHLVSDHCPAVIKFPDHTVKKPKPFRFSNYIVERPNFIEVVKDEWCKGGETNTLGQCMGKLKRLKKTMKQMNWQNGDLFERVKNLKIELRNAQQMIDKFPFNEDLRKKGVSLLEQINEAIRDEELFLFQKAKVEWLRDGDRNSAFFRKTIKGGIHRNKVMQVCNDQGIKFEGDDVATQFVEHFTKFLGTSYLVQEIRQPDSLFLKKVS